MDYDITTDTTWTIEESPYIVTCDISIYSRTDWQTVALTIEPGVEIRFNTNAGIYAGHASSDRCSGAISAHDTETNPVIFTYNSDILAL